MSVDRYHHVESRKREGAHYTPENFSDFISESILLNANLGESVKIVDPAVGDGELLISLIRKLKSYGIQSIEVYGFDTNPVSIEIANRRLEQAHADIIPQLYNNDFLQVCLEKGGDSGSLNLFPDQAFQDIPQFDLLIANPPYVRTQVLGAEQAQLLSRNFGLKGRVDLYQAFLIAMKAVLNPNAIAGVIVSNRFLTTKGAGKFREILHNQYEIKGIWDFGDTKVFDAAVLPAVMLLSQNEEKNDSHVPFLSVYLNDNKEIKDAPIVKNQIEALKYTGIVSSEQGSYQVKNGYLTYDSKSSDVWRLQDDVSEAWLNQVAQQTWCVFKEIGKIRVGVKTTADNVFIKSDWMEDVGYHPELLLPLTTHHVAGRFRCSDEVKKNILYTHTVVDGNRIAVDLKGYPLSKKYLEGNKKQLKGRKYVIDANRKWFEIWVPQNPLFWSKNKIVFRDISEQPVFWMDKEGTVVNGDCYWMFRENEESPEDILWLALAIANSKFIEDFYDIKFQNKLYSNRRRFITQYVEQFPIPDPATRESKNLIALSKQCYKEKDEDKRVIIEGQIDSLVWSVFGVSSITG